MSCFHLARRVAFWSDHETGLRLQCVIQRAEAAARSERFEWYGNQVDPRYRMKDETIIRMLDITGQEMVELDFKHLLTPDLKRARERARWHFRRSAQGRLSRAEFLMTARGRRAQAAQLRSQGLSWDVVGNLMGVTADAARKLAVRFALGESGQVPPVV